MTAYHSTTFRAVPLYCFFIKELIDAILFDKFEIFYHAHMVFGSVTFIEGFQPATGKILALIAEPNKAFTQTFTLLLHKDTVLATWQASRTVFLRKPLVLEVIFHRQVADANTTIHSTRGNKFFFHFQSTKFQSCELISFTLNIAILPTRSNGICLSIGNRTAPLDHLYEFNSVLNASIPEGVG